MKTNQIILILFLVILTPSCSSMPGGTPSPSPTENPSLPSLPRSDDFIPQPSDSSLSRDKVFLDTSEVVTMESFPLQFSLHLTGNLPTPCHQLRISVSPVDTKNIINVDVYSVVDPNMVCAQTLEPFDVNFSLGSYPTGHYLLYVNGELTAEFVA